MTFGKLIAWNKDQMRGIIEDRQGETYTVERKDFMLDQETAILAGAELAFEVWDEQRSAYAVRTCTSEFLQYNEFFGDEIA